MSRRILEEASEVAKKIQELKAYGLVNINDRGVEWTEAEFLKIFNHYDINANTKERTINGIRHYCKTTSLQEFVDHFFDNMPPRETEGEYIQGIINDFFKVEKRSKK